MRFVDSQKADLRAFEERERVGLGEAFGRDVDEAQPPLRDLVEDLEVLAEVVHGIEARGRDAIAAELRHLVAHQRDQRRYHHREPLAQQRGKLIAQRLPAPCRHDRQHIAAGEDRLHDLALAGAKGLEPEGRPKNLLRNRKIGHFTTIGRSSGQFPF